MKSGVARRVLRLFGKLGIDGRRQLAVTAYCVRSFFDAYLQGASVSPGEDPNQSCYGPKPNGSEIQAILRAPSGGLTGVSGGDGSMSADNMFGSDEQAVFGSTPTSFEVFVYSVDGILAPNTGGSILSTPGLVAGTFFAAIRRRSGAARQVPRPASPVPNPRNAPPVTVPDSSVLQGTVVDPIAMETINGAWPLLPPALESPVGTHFFCA